MSEKTIVITGTGSGLGRELVKAFEGNKIFAGHRNKEGAEFGSDNIIPFYIDLTNRESIKAAADFIKSQTQKIDLLLNVAGCVVAGPVEQIDTDELRRQFDVNVFSHIELSQHLLPLLAGGKIINISSMASFGHFPFISPYCASKRALDIFFNALAVENHKNIRVISVKPGVIATPIWEKSVKANEKALSNRTGYEKEMTFLKNNALSNTSKGLKVEEVAKFIKKISELKNPKSSYTVGKDAKVAELLSYFPQDFINPVVKFGLKIRIK